MMHGRENPAPTELFICFVDSYLKYAMIWPNEYIGRDDPRPYMSTSFVEYGCVFVVGAGFSRPLICIIP